MERISDKGNGMEATAIRKAAQRKKATAARRALDAETRVEKGRRVTCGPEKAGSLELNGSRSTRFFTTDVGSARHQFAKVAHRTRKRAQGCRQEDPGHFLCYGHKNLI